jgi:hypothetical protein
MVTPTPPPPGSRLPLPRDAKLVELRPEHIALATRDCLLPDTWVRLRLVLEGRPLALELPVEACLVVARDKAGYLFHLRLTLAALSEADRQLLALFIFKGRGAPELLPPEGR